MTSPEIIFNTRRWCISSLTAFLFLLAIGVLATAQPVFNGTIDWKDAVKLTLPMLVSWTLFAPLAVELAFRFPLERSRLLLSVTVHLIAFALICLINQNVTRYFMECLGFTGSGGTSPWIGHGPDAPMPRPPAAARIAMDLLIYGILVSICQTVAWSRRAHERERRALTAEAHLARARLAALRMQLNPHFLFNALNGISTLIHTDPRAADDMIGNLSELLRLSLDSTEEQEIPLRRELDFLQCYLDIEQARFGGRLVVERDIAPEAFTAFLPTLLLQPLIENAILHGLAPQCRSVCIRLTARRQGGHLLLNVSDDGAGFPDPAQDAADTSHVGIGLNNTRARLLELYGSHQSLSIRNGPSRKGPVRGCTVDIQLPFHTEPIA